MQDTKDTLAKAHRNTARTRSSNGLTNIEQHTRTQSKLSESGKREPKGRTVEPVSASLTLAFTVNSVTAWSAFAENTGEFKVRPHVPRKVLWVALHPGLELEYRTPAALTRDPWTSTPPDCCAVQHSDVCVCTLVYVLQVKGRSLGAYSVSVLSVCFVP